jgi:putative membrane protein
MNLKLMNRAGVLLMAATLAFSCGSKNHKDQDSNETAKEANGDKFHDAESEKDAEFVSKAVACNYKDIQLSKLARQKSNNAQVKEVAKSLETEHQKLLKDLQNLAGEKAISVPTEPEDNEKRKIEDLKKESNIKDFNKEWCKEMVTSHESTIKDFENRWENTKDPELKNWIAETLPHLRAHLDKVKSCDENIASK